MTNCPGRDQLERLLAVPCGDGAGEELELHVESCPACQQALESMAGASDWGPDLEGWPALAATPGAAARHLLARAPAGAPVGGRPGRAGRKGAGAVWIGSDPGR